MLEAARARLSRFGNVEVRKGQLEKLPIADSELDVAAIVLALHHVAEPRAALAEAARTLKEGGRLLIVDMQPHDREDYQREMGHVWLGFAPDVLQSFATAAGLEAFDYVGLPADLEARGPSLFVARARRAQSADVTRLDSATASRRKPKSSDVPDHRPAERGQRVRSRTGAELSGHRASSANRPESGSADPALTTRHNRRKGDVIR
jgi:SAM-dependent methyltransferase